jgi:NADH-quinone oxidoreductase subunit M
MSMLTMPGILTLITFLPAAGALLILLARTAAPGNNPALDRGVRAMTLIVTIATFILNLVALARFDWGSASFQLVERMPWAMGVEYHLGVDGLGMALMLLTTFLMPLCILASASIEKQVASYMTLFLMLETLMLGVFCSLDLALFYVFFEGGLIPMFILIGVWGGARRIYAAFKFFLYTLLGSLLMLVALVFLYFKSGGSFDILTWHRLPFGLNTQTLLFFAFLAAFSVKVPMWPVHTWLPDAHVEAPTGGSVVLAAIMLKLGAYGFLRFSMPIAPDASREWAWFIIALSLIAVIYIGLVALVQQDMKKLVAYSSIAHMGFVTLGFFIFSELGVSGGLVQMVSHGFVSGAMFLCIGVLYDRVHSREIAAYGGVANTMPKFAAFAVLFAMANCGLPGTAGFVGEWMVILGTVKVNFWLAALASTTLVFGAAYTLWMVKRVYFGAVANKHVAHLADIGAREFFMLGLLAVAVLWMGLYPKPFTDVMHVSVTELLKHVALSKLNAD